VKGLLISLLMLVVSASAFALLPGDVESAKQCTATHGTPVYSHGGFTGCLWSGDHSKDCVTKEKDGETILACDSPTTSKKDGDDVIGGGPDSGTITVYPPPTPVEETDPNRRTN
jgi:hypothetical protein